MTKELPSPELLRKLLRYEPDTGKLFWRERDKDMFKSKIGFRSWNTKYSGKEAVTANCRGYRVGAVLNFQVYAHRVAWAMYYGFWPNKSIDHINGNRSDNRIVNLRDVSLSQNARNSRMRSSNKSGYNGVHYCNRSKKWCACIKLHGVARNLGYFDDIESAASARMDAESGLGFTDRHGTAN